MKILEELIDYQRRQETLNIQMDEIISKLLKEEKLRIK
jgi:hypothetical protein